MNLTQQTSLPLLAAWEPCAELSPQQYNYTATRLPTKFVERGRSLYQKSNPVEATGVESEVIMALLSPSDVTNADVKLSRPRGHRPVIESYKTSFVRQFVSGATMKPAQVILDYFGGGINVSMTDGSPVGDGESKSTSRYRDNGDLYSVCSHHLPVSYPLRCVPFDGRKAVVWLCIPGETTETTPEFLCVAGWTRWCALKEAMELADINLKAPPMEEFGDTVTLKREEDDVLSANEGPPLDYSIPVYMLDGRGFSELDIHCLSVYLNILDSEQIQDDDLDKSGKKSKAAPISVSALEIKSRPYGLPDFFLMIDAIVEQVLSKADDALYFTRIKEYISEHDELGFMWHWLMTGVYSEREDGCSPGIVSLMNAPIPAPELQLEYLCGFLVSFAYPFDYRRNDVTVNMVRASGVERTAFWDRVLYQLLPYQALCSVPLTDICSVIRAIEPFMMIRSKSVVGYYMPVEWDQHRSESFVNHFVRQNESVSRFVSRLCSSEKIREMRSKNVLWPYDSLASCTCFYNYHYLIELDSELAGSDEIPADISGDPEGKPTIRFHPGTERALLLVRAILLYAALTFQNASLQFQLARTEFQDAPLERIVRPKLFEEMSRSDDNEQPTVARLKYEMPKAAAEHYFEVCLGILGELIFRCVCSGLGRASLYHRNINQQELVPNEGLSAAVLANEGVYLRGMMQGGALAVQYLLTAVYSPQLEHAADDGGSGISAPVDAILPLLTSGGNRSSYHCFQITNMVSCRRRIYENCLLLQTTGFDPGSFSHLHILFNVLMLFHERGIEESTETARELLQSESVTLPALDRSNSLDLKPDILARAVTQIHESWTKPPAETAIAAPRTSTHHPEAKTRIIRWFEETKNQARDLMNELYMSFKALDGAVVLACDFRDKTPEEAKAMAGTLSELAADSTNLTSSLQEVPYQFGVMNCSHFRFSRRAVEAVLAELGTTMRRNLEEGMSTYLNVPDASDVVVVSARPGVICALWQSLTHLSPFFDLLHPLACQWLSLRALFTSWIWGCIRENMMDLWRELCVEKLGASEAAVQTYPALRFTLRRLPARFDKTYLQTIIDLTPERLSMLFRGPGPLDKIGAAFYRFQCSSMADARSVLGCGANGGVPLVKDLPHLLQCPEPCLKPLFETLWASLDGELQAEDVLNDAQIAAAGFLKKYAKYVLTGLETQDRSFDAQGQRIDVSSINGGSCAAYAAELGGDNGAGRTRKRKVLLKEEEVGLASRGAAPTRKLEEIPKAVLAGYSTLHELKRDLKLLSRVDSGGGVTPGPQTQTQESGGEWLGRLPTCLIERLRDQPVPRDPLVNDLISRFQQLLRSLRRRQQVPQGGQNKRRRVGENEGTEREAMETAAAGAEQRPSEISSVFYNLPGWLRGSPLWSMWGSALRKENSVLFNIPSSLELKAQAYVDHKEFKLTPMDWDLIRTVLDYLSERGVTSMYCSRTREVIPINPRGAFSDQAYAETDASGQCDDGLKTPAPGSYERRGAMDRFRSILEGDLIGYRRFESGGGGGEGSADSLTSSLL